MEYFTLSLVILSAHLAIPAQQQACLSNSDEREITYRDGTSGLQIRRNVSRTRPYTRYPPFSDLPVDIFSFDRKCNLILRSFKLPLLNKCNMKVTVSESEQLARHGGGASAFEGLLSCPAASDSCFIYETSRNLPQWNVTGMVVILRVLSGGEHCVLAYNTDEASGMGWFGVTLFTTDVDECTSDTHDCTAGAVCENTIGTYKCIRNFSIVNSTARKPATKPSQPNSEIDYVQISTRHASISYHVTSAITSHPNNTQDLPSTGVLSKTMSEIARSTSSNDRFPDTTLLDYPSSLPSVTSRSENVTTPAGPESDDNGSGNTSKGTTVIVASIPSAGFILAIGIVLVIYVKYRKRCLPEIIKNATRQDYANSSQMKVRNNDQLVADSRASKLLTENNVQVKKEEPPISGNMMTIIPLPGLADDHPKTKLPADYQFRNGDVTYAYAYRHHCIGHEKNLAYPSNNPDTAYEVVDTQNASYKDRNQTKTEASFVGTVNPAYGIHGQAC